MKPQLIVSDLGGYHNDNLPETVARLTKGGSWKKQRVVVVLPAADVVPAKCVLSWWNLAFPPNNGVAKIMALGQEVGEAYSNAIEMILAEPNLSQWEFLLTVEHDNIVPGDGVVKLIERLEENPWLSAVSGLYFTKGVGGAAQIWGDVSDPIPNYRPQVPRGDGGLQECVGIGMGFALWRLPMFKDDRIKRPWFRTHRGLAGEGVGTQDLTFATEARKYGYRFAVDCGVKVGHYDLKGEFSPHPDFVW